jgi:hypothetical protein
MSFKSLADGQENSMLSFPWNRKIHYRIDGSAPADHILSHLKHTDSEKRISCMLKAIIMATLPIFQVMYDNSNSTGICTV